MATQDAACLDGDYAYLTIMDRLGYRVMGLTYSESNMLGDGCGERTREIRGVEQIAINMGGYDRFCASSYCIFYPVWI